MLANLSGVWRLAKGCFVGRIRVIISVLIVISTFLFGSIGAANAVLSEQIDSWLSNGATSRTTGGNRAHAIILFIGDGMGTGQRTGARWSKVGQNGLLAMDDMPYSGWSRTSSANSAVTDSAAAATALATGVKTNNGMVGVDPNGNRLTTILELAKAGGMAVGLVTTTPIVDATPASFAAHVRSRSEGTEIARQMLENRVDVLLGGGEDYFLPNGSIGCYPQMGKRDDMRNLIVESIAAGYTYTCDSSALATIDPTTTTHLLGLFADEGMVRPFAPSLAEMTQKAIDILSRDPDGFFLMVEGGQIDWASHTNDAVNAIGDTIGLDEAVEIGKAYASTAGNTLVIVTADHETGGMGVAFSPTGLPGEDGPLMIADGGEFYVGWTTTGHTSADVPTTALGPSSELLYGTYENTHIFDVLQAALGWRVWLPLVTR